MRFRTVSEGRSGGWPQRWPLRLGLTRTFHAFDSPGFDAKRRTSTSRPFPEWRLASLRNALRGGAPPAVTKE